MMTTLSFGLTILAVEVISVLAILHSVKVSLETNGGV
jgi:hypothetical protein